MIDILPNTDYWKPGTPEYDKDVKEAGEHKIKICTCMHPFMDHFGEQCKLCPCWKERYAYTTTIKEHYKEDMKRFAEHIIGTVKDRVDNHTEEKK